MVKHILPLILGKLLLKLQETSLKSKTTFF
jgi:hypothetical protein